MHDLRELIELAQDVADLKRRFAGMVRHGTVEEVDTEKQVMRLKMGEGPDGPFLSPWVPYNQVAGALKIHSPPSKGQQMTLFSPTGDWRQGLTFPFTWSDQNKSPSDKPDEHVATFGDFRLELRGNELIIEVPRLFIKCGGSTFELTGEGLKMVAPDYEFQ